MTNVTGESKVSEEEIKKFYEENKEEKFKHDEEVRASHILIGVSEADIKNRIKSESDEKLSEEELQEKVNKEMQEAKTKAQKLYNELNENSDKFAEYAKQYSEDPSSASKGGDLGFFSKDEMVPEFAEAAFSTKPGKISGPIKTEFGYHVIKVVDRKKEGVTPLDEIKPHIERYLEGKEKMEAFTKLIEEARKSAEIVYVNEDYDPENIKKEYRELIEDLRQKKQVKSEDPEKAEQSEKN